MSDTEHKDENPAISKCEPRWDTNDPLQQEVSRIMKGLPRDLCGVLALGSDGVLRSVTADRKILGAEGLSVFVRGLCCNVADRVEQPQSSLKLSSCVSQKITGRR